MLHNKVALPFSLDLAGSQFTIKSEIVNWSLPKDVTRVVGRQSKERYRQRHHDMHGSIVAAINNAYNVLNNTGTA